MTWFNNYDMCIFLANVFNYKNLVSPNVREKCDVLSHHI